MKINISELSSVERKIEVEIDIETVKAELDNAYVRLKKNIKVRGFRPGKAPRNILEKQYGAKVNDDVKLKLIEESFPEVIKENKLEPVAYPNIDNCELNPEEPFKYTATIEIRPEITVPEYNGLGLTQPVTEAGEEEFDAELEKYRQSAAQMVSIEEDIPVEMGHHVVVNFESFVDGKPVKDGVAKGVTFEIGSEKFKKDLEEQIVGMKKGDTRDIKTVYDDTHPKEEIAGKEVVFKVDLVNIQNKVIPELNDEFAKDVGKFETLDELKSFIKDQLNKKAEMESRESLKNQVISQLIQKTEFDIPKSMMDAEYQSIISRIQQNLSQYGIDPATFNENERQTEYMEAAERNIRSNLIITAVAEQEKIEIDEEDIKEGYKKIGEQMGVSDIDFLQNYYKQNKMDEMMRHQFMFEKTINHIISKADITKAENIKDESPGEA